MNYFKAQIRGNASPGHSCGLEVMNMRHTNSDLDLADGIFSRPTHNESPPLHMSVCVSISKPWAKSIRSPKWKLNLKPPPPHVRVNHESDFGSDYPRFTPQSCSDNDCNYCSDIFLACYLPKEQKRKWPRNWLWRGWRFRMVWFPEFGYGLHGLLPSGLEISPSILSRRHSWHEVGLGHKNRLWLSQTGSWNGGESLRNHFNLTNEQTEPRPFFLRPGKFVLMIKEIAPNNWSGAPMKVLPFRPYILLQFLSPALTYPLAMVSREMSSCPSVLLTLFANQCQIPETRVNKRNCVLTEYGLEIWSHLFSLNKYDSGLVLC